MRAHLFATLAVLLPTGAVAGCAPNMTTLVSCTVSDGTKAMDVCSDGAHVLYRFGAMQQTPDIELISTVRKVGYTPWVGIGSSIWESVSIGNGDVTYEAYSSIGRNPDDPEISGGVEVLKAGKTLASIACDARSVQTNMDALFNMREAAGLCYDHARFAWDDCN